MPTYRYECSACGHALEAFHSMTARPLRKCPACKAAKLERLIGPGAGFIFKGSGFYITDYRKPQPGGGDSAGGAKDGKAKDQPAGGSGDPGKPSAKERAPKGDKVA